jgi:hypothetical protein
VPGNREQGGKIIDCFGGFGRALVMRGTGAFGYIGGMEKIEPPLYL